MIRPLLSAILALVITNNASLAQEVRLTENLSSVSVEVAGQLLTIERNQDTQARLGNEFTKTSRPWPPVCIAPIEAAAGVRNIGELDVINLI